MSLIVNKLFYYVLINRTYKFNFFPIEIDENHNNLLKLDYFELIYRFTYENFIILPKQVLNTIRPISKFGLTKINSVFGELNFFV